MITDLDQALAIAKSNLGLSGYNKDVELTILLTASAGVKLPSPTLYYRPYIVAAYLLPLWGVVSRGGLVSADGATWLKPADFLPLITSLLTLQESADCGLTINPCWSTEELRSRLLCGCDSEKASVIPMLGATVL